jgi:peptidoglycan/LPS O-acetylase OafA/YrhL
VTNTQAGRSIERRNDIDGLRAVAVLGVVLHHAGLPALPAHFYERR